MMGEGEARRPARIARLKNSVRIEIRKEVFRTEGAEFKTDQFVREVLAGVFRLDFSTIFCLQDFSQAGFLDLTFGDMETCLQFVAAWDRNQGNPALKGLEARALYMWEDIPVTVHMYNPFVEEEDIRLFLNRYCLKVEGGRKLTNAFGIWTGKRRYLVRFRPDPRAPGGVVHPPGSFAIGPHRGFLFFPGQPVTCRNCGQVGHVKATCSNRVCRFCGSHEHESAACSAPKKCSFCGGEDHLYRACPLRKRSFASLFSSERREEEQTEQNRRETEGQTKETAQTTRGGDIGADQVQGEGGGPDPADGERREVKDGEGVDGKKVPGQSQEGVGSMESTSSEGMEDGLHALLSAMDQQEVGGSSMDISSWAESPVGTPMEVPEWVGKRPFPEEDVERVVGRRACLVTKNRFMVLESEDGEEDSEPPAGQGLCQFSRDPLGRRETEAQKEGLRMGRGRATRGRKVTDD